MDLPYFSADDVKARTRACLDFGLQDVRISGTHSVIVGGTGTDPADGIRHRLLVNGRLYAIVSPDEDDDESAPDSGYKVGDFEQYQGYGWVSIKQPYWEGSDGEIVDCYLTLDRFMERVASPVYWRSAFAGLLELHKEADQAFTSIINAINPTAISAIDEHVSNPSSLQHDPELDPPDVEGAFQALMTACSRREPRGTFLELQMQSTYSFGHVVAFGHRRGQPDEVRYELRAYFMTLDGVKTTTERYEADIAAHHSDPWARLGALLAARDLIAISELLTALSDAEDRRIRGVLADEEAELKFDVYRGIPGADEALASFDYFARLRASHAALCQRVDARYPSLAARHNSDDEL